MKTVKYLLVSIGIVGMIASVYLGIVDKDIMTPMSSFIASLSLVYLGLYKVVSPTPTTCLVKVEKTKDSF